VTHDKILILDFGAQYSQLIARRVRESHVYCELHPHDVADGFIRERAVVFERLRRLGVHCLDVPAERIGMELINRYLLIKQRELI